MATTFMAKILLVEDDALIQHMYQQMLEMRGHHVVVAGNGLEGIEQAGRTKPVLILLDIMMPKLNGLDMLKRIKKMPELSNIPVMILTNLMGAADAQTALATGAIKYVIKSDYSANEVADIVEDVLASLHHKPARAAS